MTAAQATQPSKYQQYLSDFRATNNGQSTNGPARLRQLRESAWSRFLELGFPTARKGNEKWKYTNVAPIADGAFKHAGEPSPNAVTASDLRSAAPWHDGWTNLVFVDGHYSKALSTAFGGDNGASAVSLLQATGSVEDVVGTHLSRYAPVENDAFAALNTAFVRDGALVHIPEGQALEAPIHLVFVSSDTGQPTVSHPRVLVLADARSKATIIESYVGLSPGRYFTNAVAELAIGEGAEIDHYRLLLESEDAFHVGVARVRQAAGSRFSSVSVAKGVAVGRYDLNVLLDGPGSSCNLNGLYVTSGVQHMDNLINIDHAKPHTTSRLYYKGILDGRSRAVFGGTVLVRENAQKTDAKQMDKNLVLSPQAEVDSKPALFIYADDVKCGHGATAGNVDQDTVFYMRSRGVDLEMASKLLIRGFAAEILDTVKVDDFRHYLEDRFLESLPSHRFEF